MKKLLLFLALFGAGSAFAADNAIILTPGSGVTERSIDIGSGVQAPGIIPVSSSGTSIYGTAGSANANILTVQGIASMTPFLVNPGTAANWGVGTSTQNSTTVANGHLALAQFNTTPTTISSGNMSPFQLDTNGNLLVNVKAGGAGGGAVTIASGAVASGAYSSGSVASGAFASGSISNGADVVEGTITTAHGCSTGGYTVIGCIGQVDDDIKGPPNLLVNGASVAWSGLAPGTGQTGTITAANVDMTSLGGVAFGAMANFGTSPGAVKVAGVNASQYQGTTAVVAEPCQTAAKLSTPISQNTTPASIIFAGATSKKNYICSIALIGSDAENISLIEGTGANCSGSTAAIIGGTTAANGVNLAANGGMTLGNGAAFVAAGNNNAYNVCLIQSGTGRVAGVLTYVQQ